MPPTFETTRFEVLREIGRGGMGVVYAALDRERNLEVALKVIRDAGSEALHSFKQEFRSIADIVHPNLICLHELFAEGDQWFFTMELIEGDHFLQYVRGKRPGDGTVAADTPQALTIVDPSLMETATGEFVDFFARSALAREGKILAGHRGTSAGSEPLQRMVSRKPIDWDLERLRSVLTQLAQGLDAVHSRGKLHRDIKSSNVMVTTQGRAVILDFGLASTISELNRMRARGLVGTLAYASPEQTAGEQLTPASDWYSVGVMMFEALTGYSPFGTDTGSLLERKLTTPPPAADDLVEGVPGDLNTLCSELLQIDPSARPSGKRVLDLLKAGTATTYYAGANPSAADFIGRERELGILNDALRAARSGSAAVAMVYGPSGFGKSSLVQKFLSGLSDRDTLLLRGRCYEQESVPYKGIDSAMDALAEHLDDTLPRLAAGRFDLGRGYSPGVIEQLPVAPLRALVQVFPVLLQSAQVRQRLARRDAQGRQTQRRDALGLDAKSRGTPVGEAQTGETQILEPQLRRRAAFACLRDIIRGLGRDRQIIFCIDDMQWSDAESVQLLSSLLASPNAPAVLYLSSYRSEYEERNPWLQQWLRAVRSSGVSTFQAPIGAFSAEESAELAARILSGANGGDGMAAAKIVGEGEGNPFFIYQLAQSAREQGSKTEALAERITLDTVLRSRFSTLPASARDLLEVIAVAGTPIAKSDAYAAAGLEHQDPVVLNILRIANLTRSFSFGGVEVVETYHDRIRESVAKSLPAGESRRRHQSLAITLERSGGADPELLAVHFEGAEERPRAAHYYELAARRADDALAFEKAARFYQKALAIGDLSEPGQSATRLKLAEALANAGRGRAAAEEFDRLSQQAPASESLELERRAGFLYCSTGHLDKGLKVYERIVARLGLREPRSRGVLTAYIVARLLALRLRGLSYRRRPAADVPRELLLRADTTWSLSAGLVLIDIPRSMNFGLMALRDALKAGEAERLLNAIVMTCWIPIMTRIGGRPLADRLLAIGEELTAQLDTPRARAMLEQSRAVTSHGCSEWKNALHHLREAELLYRNHCTGVSWQLASVNTIHLYTQFVLGDYADMGRRAEATIKDAIESGDLYSQTVAETFPSAFAQLADDRPADALQTVRKGLARWSTRGYDVQNAMGATVTGFIEFYEGRAALLLPYMEEQWAMMSKYGFDKHPAMRPPFLSFWVRAALAKAALPATGAGDREKLWKVAQRKTKMLQRSPGRFGEAAYPCAVAELAEARGDKPAALAGFARSEALYRSLDMKGYAAAVLRRRGSLLGGEQGSSMVREADERLRDCGAVDPQRLAATLAGGWQPQA